MPSSPAPNILFFLPDQWHADWLGLNPDLRLATPNLDRLAKRGVMFRQAYTPSPLCSPARACLATGRDYACCRVPDNSHNTPPDLPTYYQRLRDAGYRVAGVGKFDLHKADHDWGLDGSKMIREYGFTEGIDNEGKLDAVNSYVRNGNAPMGPYMQFLKERGLDEVHRDALTSRTLNGRPSRAYINPLPEDAYCDNWVAEQGMRFLRDFPGDQPWHLVCNFVGPHDPFDVTESMHERWKNVDVPPAVDNDTDAPEEVRACRQHYAAMVENIDRHLGRMLSRIEERGELDRTLVVFSSDHGEMLGDHGLWGKSVPYEGAAGIPLLIAGPGVGENVRSDALVSLHDLAATFVESAGASPLPEAGSRSLWPVLEGKTEDHRDIVTSGLRKWRMVFDGRWKFVSDPDGGDKLFDLAEDPHELDNCIGKAPGVADTLRARLPGLPREVD